MTPATITPRSKKALELADVKGFGKRKREVARARQAARHRLFDLYRGLRHRAVARRSARSAPASACGNRPRCGSTRPARSRSSPAATATARATRPPSRSSSRERLGIPIDNVSVVHGDTDKVQFGMGTYGSRSGAVGMSAIVKALDKVEAKAKKVAAFMLEAAEGDIEFKDGKFTVAGTDKSAAWGDVALNAYIAHKFAGAELEPGPEGGRVLRSDQLHLPGRLPHLRGRDRSGDRQHRDRRLDRGRRLRHRDQSDDRRRPGAWRHRAGRRPGAARRRGLRQGRPARHRLVHGLLHAARRRPAVVQGRHDR